MVAIAALGAVATLAAQGPEGQALRAKVLATKTCAGCDLSGVMFVKGADLKGANLSGAKLIGAGFYGVDLTNANLQGADLSNAILTSADLSNANLGGANLSGANLAHAKGASLAAAITDGRTTCPGGEAGPCQ